MSKNDVRINNLLTWDEYKDKPPDDALPAIYSYATNSSRNRCGWYWESIKTKRRLSISILLFTLIFLIIGTLLPIVAGVGDEADVRLQYTQFGVASLAIAGLLQIVDRVFGLSSGWLRYMTTVTAMENATRKFELDWASYLVDKASNIGR
jgi:SMODS and SLOG-associating 2TM effector domain 2